MNEFATYLALFVVIGFFGFLAWALLWRAAMANITLTAPQKGILPGDKIDVSLLIEARRPLEWDFVTLSLVCRDTKDREDNHPAPIIYRKDIQVAGKGTLGGGALKEFEASFIAPEKVKANGVLVTLPSGLETLVEPLLGAADARRARDLDWRVEARVATYLELSASRRLEFQPADRA